ncbi:unnamed protein product [Rotaria sordida]|uniref:TRPM SLOG domain-containing protein n=1 Tax=Rotaria sordida TaxID=392033 RepID=A0A819DI83_9BILA|nr:unnamed protein product [Rotaria sordida]
MLEGNNPQPPQSRFTLSNDHGVIHFAGNHRKSDYVRFQFDGRPAATPVENHPHTNNDNMNVPDVDAIITDYVRNKWQLSQPELIISLIGGNEYFKNVSNQTRKLFQQGIISAASNTNAWIITDGLHLGVAREVGLAFDQLRYKNIKTIPNIQCIGIVDWNIIKNNQQLEQFSYTTSDSECELLYQTRQRSDEQESNDFPLDHNHTHFLIFNLDSDLVASQADTNWFTRLQIEIEEKLGKITQHGQSNFIPVIQILFGDNISSIASVCESIKREIPVIVITDTGITADLIVHEYHNLYGENQDRLEVEYENAMQKPEFNNYDTNQTFGSNQTRLNGMTRQFIEMMKSEKGHFLLNSFQLSENEPEWKLDEAILSALYNAVHIANNTWERNARNLILATACKKYERVKQYIFEKQSISNWPSLELDKPLKFAIHGNYIRFIELFIEHGTSFERLRRLITINDLYKNLTASDRSAMLPIVNENDQSPMVPNVNESDQSTTIPGVSENDRPAGARSVNENNRLATTFNINESDRSATVPSVNENDQLVIAPEVNENDRLAAASGINENDRSATAPSVNEEMDIRRKYYAGCFKSNMINFDLNDQENGQYLGIGFSNSSGQLYQIQGNISYYKEMNSANEAYSIGQPTRFTPDENCSIGFTYKIQPAFNFIRDLLLWSTLMDRLYLTIFFCSQTENTIVASLLITKVYQIAGESEKNSEKKLIYREREKIFDEHATIIMNRCFNINEDAAIQILTSPSELYFNYSPLELAEDNGSHSFLGTKCVQTYLDRQWSGAIIYNTQSSIWIRTLQAKDLLIFPIFILIFLMAYSITSYSLMATKNQIEQNSGNMSHINNSNITNNQIMEINEPSIIDEITQNNITNNHSLMFTVKKKNKIDLEFLQMIPIHVRNIIDWGMWKVYGQVEILDQKTADGITLNADNDAYGNTTFILTIVFVCISNLLLLNVLVALFKMNVKYKFELKLYLAIIYGPLLINNKLNWTIHNMITFNSKDQVKLNGIINKVSIHFSTAPTAQEPEIWLFVMKSGIKPNEFDIVRYQQLKEVKRKTGVQIFTDLNMQIDKDQYLAIRFSSEAGNPITLEGNQYYSYFDFGHHLARTIPFTICKNKRIAMNFQVLPNGYVSLNNNKSRSNKYKKKSSQRKRKSTNYKPTRVLIRCYNYHVINTQYRIDI